MRILLFFLYAGISILATYLSEKLFFGIQLIFSIIFVIYIVFCRKTNIEKKTITTSLVCMIVLVSVSSALFFALLNHKSDFIGNYSTFNNLDLLNLFIICLFSPIIEEFIFRSFWLKFLNEKMSDIKSVMISAVGFSLSHFYSDIALIYPLILGLFLGWLYLKFKNIYLCIIFHMIYNTSIILINSMLETTNIINWKNYVMLVSFIIICLVIIVLNFKQKTSVNPDVPDL